MNEEYPKDTIFCVALLVSEVGEKKLMIASFYEDDNYQKNRNNFLTLVMARCKLEHLYIEDIQSIRSKEELEALKSCVKNKNNE